MDYLSSFAKYFAGWCQTHVQSDGVFAATRRDGHGSSRTPEGERIDHVLVDDRSHEDAKYPQCDVFCHPYQYLATRSGENFLIDRTINSATVDSNLLPDRKLDEVSTNEKQLLSFNRLEDVSFDIKEFGTSISREECILRCFPLIPL